MNIHNMRSALKEYEQVGIRSQVEGAPPERLVQMLLEGALDRISTARGAMENGEIALKGERISKAISMIEGLRASLDHDRGADLAGNLDALYDYMARRLAEANLRNEVAILDEVATLLREIKQAWDRVVEAPGATSVEALMDAVAAMDSAAAADAWDEALELEQHCRALLEALVAGPADLLHAEAIENVAVVYRRVMELAEGCRNAVADELRLLREGRRGVRAYDAEQGS